MPLAEEKQKYWDVVVDCLVEIFGQQVTEARDKATLLRSTIEKRRGAWLFYHAEPVDVAADLADRPLEYGEVQGKYSEILHRRHWAPTQLPEGARPSGDKHRLG